MIAIDIQRAFTYAFEDKRWPVKLGLLLLIGLIPGLNVIAWLGYQVSIGHRLARSLRNPLPEWDEWADIFIRGLITLMAGFLYFVPVLIVGIAISGVGLIFGRGGGSLLLLAVRCVGGVGILAYSLLALLLLSIGAARYARTDQYAPYFAIGDRLRDLSGGLRIFSVGFVYEALLIVVMLVLLPFSLLTIIGPFVILSAFSVVNGYLLGSTARNL